jgi:hypothetical protein
MYSVTAASLLLRGQLNNEYAVDREGVRIIPGIYGDPGTYAAVKDASGNQIKNTTPMTAFDYHFSDGYGAYGADETNVYDVTTIRLREVSLGYEVPRDLLKKTPFDSQLVGYGYEDTLFAAELTKAGYQILHINNPVLHAGLENSKDFLNKIEESLDNLFRLKELCSEKKISFPVRSKLMLLYRMINFPLFRPFFAKWFIRNKPHWRNQLLGKNPSLPIFDLYRLAFLLDQ